MRWIKATLIAWVVLVVIAVAIGGIASFYTGKVDEIPKWNGIDYLLFSMREFGTIGSILAVPVAMVSGTYFWLFAKLVRNRASKGTADEESPSKPLS